MKTYLKIKNIFIHSEKNNKSFFAEFGDNLTVVYGANTSGKSTLIQLILYTFGINDNKNKLTEILSENIFSRIDCSISRNNVTKKYSFIRNEETLYLKDYEKGQVITFNGIGGNNSAEHSKLKHFFSRLFNFNLLLETKDGISDAPIETIFLPYYVSQEVGWVYLRKSFSNLDFFKNFKDDFLDYYLGITNLENKEERKNIENELSEKIQKHNFYLNFQKNDKAIVDSKIVNDSFKGKGNEFINDLTEKKNVLLHLENQYIKKSNLLTYNTQRLSVISKVSRNHEQQFPGKDECPICKQILPNSTENLYSFFQAENDTANVKSDILTENKKIQSEINSLNKKIDDHRQALSENYRKHISYSVTDITLNEWIDNQATVRLETSIIEEIGRLAIDISNLRDKLRLFKSGNDIEIERRSKNSDFKRLYVVNSIKLELPVLEDNRYNYVYDLSSFPFQGVQLHLAVLAYHFAFNQLIKETSTMHRFPFILDSVFKEDLDGKSKEAILDFICKHVPSDTQTIISIADNKSKDPKIDYYRSEFFNSSTIFICIGDSTSKKSILSDHTESLNTILNDSFTIMEYV